MSTIGERIKELRLSFNPKLSKRAFGEKIGVSMDVINNLELDRIRITDDRLLLIAKTYGVRYEWLKTGELPMYPPESDDFLVRVTRIMEGENPNKLDLIRMIMDMPDELIDWVYEYYESKKEKRPE